MASGVIAVDGHGGQYSAISNLGALNVHHACSINYKTVLRYDAHPSIKTSGSMYRIFRIFLSLWFYMN